MSRSLAARLFRIHASSFGCVRPARWPESRVTISAPILAAALSCHFGGKALSLNRLWFQLPNLDLEIPQARKSVRQEPKGPE